MRIKTALLIISLAMSVATADSAKRHDAKNDAVLRVETRLIQLSVVAQDSHGRAIKNLTRDDFKLFDNGKRVPIDIFSALSLTPRSAPPLPPGTFSNRVEGGTQSLTVVLLDGLNTAFSDQSWARTEVVRFLQDMQPQDRAAILLLGDRLYVLQNFTSDPRLLLLALERAKVRNSKELEASSPYPLTGETDQSLSNEYGGSSQQPTASEAAQQMLSASMASGSPAGPGGGSVPAGGSMSAAAAAAAEAEIIQSMQQFELHETAFFEIDRVQRTMDALIAIANYLSQFPGRKNLIWVSGSFPISIGFDKQRNPGDTRDQVHFSPRLELAFKALNNADLAVYPVDARGLVAGPTGTVDMNDFYSTQGTMEEIADHTGGRAYFNTNDLARVMRAAVGDSQADYTLGFYPRDIRWDGKYHTLKVEVTKPGVHLRYRKGYFAVAKPQETGGPANTLLDRALSNPLDSTALGLTVTLQKLIHIPSDRALLGIDLDARNISLGGAGDKKSVQLAMVVAQSGADGRVLDAVRYDLKMKITGSGVNRFLREGLDLRKWVDLVKGATTLEIVVRDPASGNLGSVRVPVASS